MKKFVTMLLAGLMLALTPAATQAGEAAAPTASEEWVGIRDYPYSLGNLDWINVRVAMQVHYDASGNPDTIRGYVAVTCRSAGQMQACSYHWIEQLFNNTLIEMSEGDMPNTGGDGFASHYGSWRRIPSTCLNHYARGFISELGIDGAHPGGTYGGQSGTWNRCA